MFHYQENIQDSNGVAQNKWSVDLCAADTNPITAPAVTIYSDRAGLLPISGNKVKATSKGYISCYVPSGRYTRRYYNANGVLQSYYEDTDMGSSFTGSLPSDVWVQVYGLPRLKLTGVGTVSIDANNAAGGSGTTTTAVYTATVSATTIAFPFFGNDAVAVRAAYTGTAQAEII